MQAATPAFRLSFLGAAGTVTGSKYLVEAAGRRLLVDCGLFQGYKALRLRNWAALPIDAASLDAVILTHAHLDHCGYLPRLVRDGFAGPVWCSEATQALCEILLPDSGRIQEEDAAYANRKGFSKHRPAMPLYTEADARRCLEGLRPTAMGADFGALPGVVARLQPQGHILGAASVRLEHAATGLLFSGDIGRPEDALMPTPHAIEPCDWLVTESTYGNRQHPTASVQAELGEAVRRAAARGGAVIIPAFAVGRAQWLLYHLAALKQRREIPPLPIYLDSPMAIDVTRLYQRFRGEHRLDASGCEQMCQAATFVNEVEDSKRLTARRGPMVVISASGMATGGRVLHHLKSFAPDRRNLILLAGFQAGGTRGAALAAGAATLRIHGEDVPLRAEVVSLAGASAHADADEILQWLRTAPRAPRRVFITHGEPDAADALRLRIQRELAWDAVVPLHGDTVDLAAAGPAT